MINDMLTGLLLAATQVMVMAHTEKEDSVVPEAVTKTPEAVTKGHRFGYNQI